MSKSLLSIAMLSVILGCGVTATETPVAVDQSKTSAASGEAVTGTLQESAEVTQASFNIADDPTVAIEVPGMHCAACAASIEKTLVNEPGVKEIRMNIEKKTATVAIDKSAFDAGKAIESLASAGWKDAEELSEESDETVQSEG